MAIPEASISKALALAPDGRRYTAYQDGNIPGAGGFENGQSLTIIGSGFGVVSEPRFSTWDDFGYELADGSAVPSGSGTNWEGNGGGANAGYSLIAANAMPGRAFAATADAPKAALINPIVTGAPLSASTFFVYRWVKNNESLSNTVQPSSSGADKLLRVHDGDIQCGTRLSFEAKPWRIYSTHAGDYSQCLIDGQRNTPTPYEWDEYLGSSPWNTPNEWHLVELQYRSNGDVDYFLDGKLLNTFVGMYHPAGMGNPLWQVSVCGYDAQSSANLNASFRNTIGELATSGELARVYISNDPVFSVAAPQLRHVQYVTSWTDSQIVIPKAYFGMLSVETSLYAHFIGSTGDHVKTIELQIGVNVVVG